MQDRKRIANNEDKIEELKVGTRKELCLLFNVKNGIICTSTLPCRSKLFHLYIGKS